MAMEVSLKINRDDERIIVNKITVYTKNKEFNIHIDQFGELIINKEEYDNGCKSSIIVRPKVSNEIGIT